MLALYMPSSCVHTQTHDDARDTARVKLTNSCWKVMLNEESNKRSISDRAINARTVLTMTLCIAYSSLRVAVSSQAPAGISRWKFISKFYFEIKFSTFFFLKWAHSYWKYTFESHMFATSSTLHSMFVNTGQLTNHSAPWVIFLSENVIK